MPRRLGPSWAPKTAPLDASGPTLFTIGYSGHSPGSFSAALKEAGVERVLDVRSRPFSRKPGFSKGPLSASLKEAGIDYVHLPALGAPAAVLDRKKAGAGFAEVAPAYRAHLSKQKGPTDEAARLARERPSALVCLESDPKECHRGILAQNMARRGFRVVHL